MKQIFILLVLSLCVSGCSQKDFIEKDQVLFEEAGPFEEVCSGCGTAWVSEKQQEPISHCPNCPSEMCEVGAMIVLQWASVHTDEKKSKIILERLEEHALYCEGCRNELSK